MFLFLFVLTCKLNCKLRIYSSVVSITRGTTRLRGRTPKKEYQLINFRIRKVITALKASFKRIFFSSSTRATGDIRKVLYGCEFRVKGILPGRGKAVDKRNFEAVMDNLVRYRKQHRLLISELYMNLMTQLNTIAQNRGFDRQCIEQVQRIFRRGCIFSSCEIVYVMSLAHERYRTYLFRKMSSTKNPLFTARHSHEQIRKKTHQKRLLPGEASKHN